METWIHVKRHVNPNGEGHDPNIFEAEYLDKTDGWSNWIYIENHVLW